MASFQLSPYQSLTAYYGDIHNHCDISYGHGPLEDALHNARLQLDFASVTVHASWPDLPEDDPELGYLVDYHRQGFADAQAAWPRYVAAMEAANEPGRLVTFPSFEWHSLTYGDYCIYYQNGHDSPLIEATDLPAMRTALRAGKTPALLIPHHIGYKQGSCGINWQAYTDELSPVAEIFSFHGLSESSQGPYPYLHSMGPRHGQSTAHYGWSQGHRFGIIGSTDHHNAFPGSYGYGRLGVWAESLTREAIWDAIAKRRTYALTGDRIELAYTLNEHLMGDVCRPDTERWLEVAISGGDSIDYVDLVHNNQLIHRESVLPSRSTSGIFKVATEFGWGERSGFTPWKVEIEVIDGHLRQVEPRLRGYGPTDKPDDERFAASSWEQPSDKRVRLHTRTRQNPALHTAGTEGVMLEVEGNQNTVLRATVNGQGQEIALAELMDGARTFYLGGFVSPAFSFHRAVPKEEYTHRFGFLHRDASADSGWYYVRVRQRNDQWAWGSPIWVEGPAG